MILQEGMLVADKFRLERMIGQGGMGSVWRAHHVGLDIPCAVKFIEGELAKLQEAQERFKREAHAAAKLDSPHVVKIYDYGVWQGTPYIAMELLVGHDLGKVLQQSHDGKLSSNEVNRVIQQVCKALTKAHAAGIVHRDLKPDNIFIVDDDDGGHGTVKILDFGVAKQTSNAIDGSNTKTGAMLGTPYYMSPEQAQGTKAVDGRSDLWSLAVIVYQCLTGRLPFESEALGDLLVKIIVSPIPVPSSVSAVPPGFDDWWRRVADRNPENRPASAKAFAESLMLALGQSMVTDVNLDRGKLMKQLGGATAVMMNTPANMAPSSSLGSTPFPPPQASTPNPYQQHHTPANPMAPPQQPTGALAQSGATFSGVEPPITLPKKGPPVAIFAGAGVLLLLGLGFGGFALMKGKSHANGGEASATASAPTAPPTETVAAKPSAEPPPQPSATVAATTPSATPSAEPSAAATTVAAGHHTSTVRQPAGAGAVKPPASAAAAATTKATTTTATTAAPAASKSPIPLGF